MPGQLCWLSSSGRNGEKILHLRVNPHDSWIPYTRSQYAVPDYKEPDGSKGWATFQTLMKSGWTLVPSAHAQNLVSSR